MKYLTAPLGYELTGDPVAISDTEGLRKVAHSMVDSGETKFHKGIDEATLDELQQFFIDNAHTFEER